MRPGFDLELDALRDGVGRGREQIASLELSERERTGIASLKARFHPVHGYSLEVSKSQLSRVPEHYERKQTLANAERYTTPELREAEQQVRGGTGRAAAMEREIFERPLASFQLVQGKLAEMLTRLTHAQLTAYRIAELKDAIV